MIIWHRHHIKPKHMGGTDEPSNILKCNVAMHAFLHKLLYDKYGYEEDRIAWLGLTGQASKIEMIHLIHKLSGSISARERIKNGTHNFLDKEAASQRNKKRMTNGTHHFLDKEWQRKAGLKRAENESHPFVGGKQQLQQLKEGRHPSQVSRTCPYCGKTGKGSMMLNWHFNNCRFFRLSQHLSG